MRIKPILVLSVLGLGLAACKPPEGLPRLEAKGPPPAPVAAPQTSAAPIKAAAAPATPACDCPQGARAAAPPAAPNSIHDRPAPVRVRAARPARTSVQRASRRASDAAPPSGGYRVNAYAGEGYRRVEADVRRGGVYSERSVQTYDYEHSSEGRVSEGSAYGGYVAGGEQGGYYGARQSTARDYSVSRTARGDAARSRAWTRVRCADGEYRYAWR